MKRGVSEGVFCIHISPAFQKKPDHIGVAQGQVESRIAEMVGLVWIGSLVDEKCRNIDEPIFRRPMQSRPHGNDFGVCASRNHKHRAEQIQTNRSKSPWREAESIHH